MLNPNTLKHNEFLDQAISCPGIFTKSECEQILQTKFIGSIQGTISQVGNEQSVLAKNFRDTICHRLPPEKEYQWIMQRILEAIQEANQQYYHFHLSYIGEPQVLEYQENGFYDWHLDIGPGRHSTRKLSMVLFLNPPDEYEGGKLLVEPRQYDLPQEQGTGVFFPSYLLHRVEPVTKGKRWTLVSWSHGNAFL